MARQLPTTVPRLVPFELVSLLDGEATPPPLQESSHYDLGRIIAEAGAKVAASGEPSPFEAWRRA